MKLIWLDLETTGLDPRKDQILEVYAAIADVSDPFRIEKEIGNFVIGQGRKDDAFGDACAIWPLVREVSTWDPFVREMHTKNGLIEDMARSAFTRRDVENALLKHVPEETDRNELPTLAGSTVHFDLGFIREHMPRLAKRLHYRIFDVSSIKLLARALGREKFPRAEAHRAKADVLESIAHGKEATEWLTGMPSGEASDPFAALYKATKGIENVEAARAGIVDVSKNPGAMKGKE